MAIARYKTQKQKVLIHLQEGKGITPLEALNKYGAFRLSAIIFDLKKDGYDIQLTKAVARKVPIPVIASGGVGSLEHLYEGLYEAGANAVLAASIFHFADYSIQEAKKFLREKNVEVRI